MHALQKFLIFPDRHLVVESKRERSYHVIISSNRPLSLSQFTECSNLCVIRQTPPKKKTLVLFCKTNPIKKTLQQGNTNKITFCLTLLVRSAFYHPLQFLWREAYLWTIIWHHVHIPCSRCSLVICCVCFPPFYATQWAAFFPPSSTHKHIDHVSHKVHSADGDCWLRGELSPHDSVLGPSQKATISVWVGEQTMLCGASVEGVYPFY